MLRNNTRSRRVKVTDEYRVLAVRAGNCRRSLYSRRLFHWCPSERPKSLHSASSIWSDTCRATYGTHVMTSSTWRHHRQPITTHTATLAHSGDIHIQHTLFPDLANAKNYKW